MGCHGGNGAEPELSLSADPPRFDPGDLVTFTLTVRAPSIRVGGVYLSAGSVGEVQSLAGEGLVVNGAGLSHSPPKNAANGAVTFRFAWRAPSAPGAVDFGVAALAANGNNASSGDYPGGGSFQWAFGCTGRTFFLDLDRDGYGASALGTKLGCDDAPAPLGYAAADGDCDENDERAHPGGTEVCNKKDDNCDGRVDEGAEPVPLWPDADGDGFYDSQTGVAKTGCGDVPGYAARGGDCDDLDESANPGAAEVCNGKDDNCDGGVDERVRPQCGTGWCSRYSPTCDPADCRPGPPLAETCNSFDDDCDGELDEDACAGGLVCSDNQCVAPGVGGSPPVEGGGAGSVVDGGRAGSSVGVGGRAPEPAPPRADAGCSLGAGARAPRGWWQVALLAATLALRRRAAHGAWR